MRVKVARSCQTSRAEYVVCDRAQPLWCSSNAVGGIAVFAMTHLGCRNRPHRLNVGLLLVPVRQACDDKSMA